MSVKTDWAKSKLLPTAGLLGWWMADAPDAVTGYIPDASGNGRHLVQALNAPAIDWIAPYGRRSAYFDGSSNPLATADSTASAVQTVFVFASADGAAFTQNRGLFSGKTTGNVLASEAAGTEFFDFYSTDVTYRKSDSVYPYGDLEAPMNNKPELMEWTRTTATSLDGFQVGQQLADTSRKWRGRFYEAIAYNRILTTNERRRVMLYFNVKYGANHSGVPLYFPDATLLPGAEACLIAPARFNEIPMDYGPITDTWEYEDGFNDFNEIAPTVPKRWEYGFTIVQPYGGHSAAVGADALRAIFDGFNDTARRAVPFYFRDKWGVVWDNVHIEEYRREHDAHKSWVYHVSFILKANKGVAVTAETPDGEYILDGGIG